MRLIALYLLVMAHNEGSETQCGHQGSILDRNKGLGRNLGLVVTLLYFNIFYYSQLYPNLFYQSTPNNYPLSKTSLRLSHSA